MEMKLQELQETATACRDAGFEAAAVDLEKKIARSRKLAVAYEHYRYVSKEAIASYCKDLKAKTLKTILDDSYESLKTWDELALVPMGSYGGIPPSDVMAETKIARERGCFDTFEVAYVQEKREHIKRPDPIVFGLVEGCTDRFYVAQWGDDVKITDLLKTNEG
jgi:hypothetical protein